jgi:hypothetical protein
MLSVKSGNLTPFNKPNVWAHVPAAFAADRPLHVAIVFHGLNNCLESLVGDAGVACRPNDPPRIPYDLAAQIDRSGTSAVVLAPQLAYDEKHGEPGVLDNGPALAKLTRDALAALGIDKPIDRATMIAISGGYQALYAAMDAFGDKLRNVYLLDAYYAEWGPVDQWLKAHGEKFPPRRLAVIYSALEVPRKPSQAFATRAATFFASTVHNSTPHDVTIDELTSPVVFTYSRAEHDEIARTDVAKVLAIRAVE